ncbi:hypothetical protein KKA23_01570 [Patescibacteria group bacterium]|nr:hypothetical protein [Patescibacteria group bacterium]
MNKFEKFKTLEDKKELIVDIEVDEETKKELFKKYENLEFLLDGITLIWEEVDEEDKESTDELPEEDSGIPIDIDYFAYEEGIDEKDKENAQKILLKKAFEEIGFDYMNPEIIKEVKEGTSGEEVDVKYYKIENPGFVLSFDGTDWVLMKKLE